MAQERLIVEIEKGKEASEGRPSMGPVYRSIFASDALPPPVEGLDSCWDIFRIAVEKYPTNGMLGIRENVDGNPGKYKWQTYKEAYDLVLKLGTSIRSCGYGEGVKCGIYGANCPEWIISMQACNAHGLYCVPLYDTLGAGAVEFIICHSEVSIAFVEEKKIPEGDNQSFDLPVKKKSDICTIMYTSGTTGDPKGVMISNESIITLLSGIKNVLENCNEKLHEKDVYISYLPLAHIFDRIVEEAMIWHGASIGFWRGDVRLLLEDIAELKPTIFVAVPRVLDRVYTGLNQKISSGGFVKHTMFSFAYSYKLQNLRKGKNHGEAAPLFDKIVFNKVKQALGGHVRIILSGAAPLSKHVEGFLRVVTCSHILQGYGLTETCAGTFVSLPNHNDMLGTVGPPVPYVDVCLESVPEMGYDALASTPRGEICVRGKPVFSGYYKREDLTKEVMIDGWFHTGDIGEWQPNGAMQIIDRKKNIFKLSQGEYVAVENLENIYGQVPIIESIWVYGNSFESFLVAVVNPRKQALEQWAHENDIKSDDFDSLCEDSRTNRYIIDELTKIGRGKKLKGFELIKAIHLDPAPFDMERDLITPTYKKKRPQLLKYYQSTIDNMYKTINKSSA
ncbi:hypothetical protein TanjilG_07550 [Lupinus angustifolius]|uniref:Long-chain-fatty-acid--CoA ligase n=1 Tax=Lupinus angustifolius TaxID=3871 RepID=A0A1J7H0T9_LUPAN|nr:hypothetical protein TanjilG_07550 [Lupinus angustifolius]